MEHQHLCVSVVPLFNHLAEAEQQKIHELVSHRKFKKGEQIFSPADEAQLVIVAQGKLKVYQLSSSGKEQLLRVSLPGSYEGESQLFGVPNDSLFAEALEPTEICLLRQRDFSNLLLHYPELSLKLLEINAEKMAKIEQQTQFLLDLFQVEENVQLNLPMKMKELAAFLGTTPVTLSRKFKLLEKQQLIQRKGRVIELTDIEGLEEL